jgi:hypothetical protein
MWRSFNEGLISNVFLGQMFFYYQKVVFFGGFPSVNSTNFDFFRESFPQIVDITKLKRKTLFKSLKNIFS